MKGLKYYISIIFFFILGIIIYCFATIPTFDSKVAQYLTVSASDLMAALPKVVFLCLMIFGTRYFIKFSSEIIRNRYEKSKSKVDLKLLLSVYSYCVWIVSILIILAVVYKIVGSMLMSISLFAFGITLALQKPILNLAGWMNIVYSKPFKIGDRVQIGIGYSKVNGVVYDITMMHTFLSEIDEATNEPSGKSLMVPNEKILTDPVINLTKGSPYIWDNLAIQIENKSDWKTAIAKLESAATKVVGSIMTKESEKWKTMIEKKENIQSKPKVNMSLTDSSIRIEVKYLCDVNNLRDTRTLINETFLESIKNNKKIKLKGSIK